MENEIKTWRNEGKIIIQEGDTIYKVIKVEKIGTVREIEELINKIRRENEK